MYCNACLHAFSFSEFHPELVEKFLSCCAGKHLFKQMRVLSFGSVHSPSSLVAQSVFTLKELQASKSTMAEQAQFCTCQNTCQRRTGLKRAGCPCRDRSVLCIDKCSCGTTKSCCKNKESSLKTLTKVESDNAKKKKTASGNSSTTTGKPKQATTTVRRPEIEYFQDSRKSKTPVNASTTREPANTGHVQKLGVRKPGENRVMITHGYALIIHNIKFSTTSQSDRNGSEKDVEAIKEFCATVGLKIDSRLKTENLTATEIDGVCHESAKNDFSAYDSLLCFILSHGNEDGILGTDGNTIGVQKIVSKFIRNESLVGKPKLFFVQACRGSGRVDADGDNVTKRLRLPTSSDTVIAYSTIKGYVSYRLLDKGTWFIQTLIEQLKLYAHEMHLMDILTLVNAKIAETHLEGCRQMPCQVSTLTKFVFFNVPTSPTTG